MNGDLPNRPFAAGACVLIGMAIIGLADSFVVGIAEIVGLWQFHMLRSAFIVPVLIVIALTLGHPILPRRPFGVAVRSLALALSMLLYFGSLAVFSVAEAAAGLFTSPIFVLLMTALLLRQQVGPVRIAAVTVGFAGTVLVLGPADDGFGWLSLFPVAAGAAYAVNALATRTLCAGEALFTLMIWAFTALGLLGAAGTAVLAWIPDLAGAPGTGFVLRPWEPVTPEILAWTAAVGLGALGGVAFLTRSYQLAEASYVAVFEYSLLIFGAFWGYLLFGQVVATHGVVGIGLIVISGVLIGWSAARVRARQASLPA